MVLTDKTGRRHELYNVLKLYPDRVLESAFTSMKHDGIITRIKVRTVSDRLHFMPHYPLEPLYTRKLIFLVYFICIYYYISYKLSAIIIIYLKNVL